MDRADRMMGSQTAAGCAVADDRPNSLRLVQRMEAIVSVSEAVLDAVQNESRLAARVADLAASTMSGIAGVWLVRPETGEPWWASDGYGEMGEDLASRLEPTVRAGLCESPPTTNGDRGDHPLVVRAGEPGAPDWLGEGDLALYSLFPVTAGGRKLGGLVIAWPDGQPALTAEDFVYARSLARSAGVSMFNARILADSATAMEDLRQSSELIDHMSDAVIACDADGQVVSWNAGAERVYGYSNAEAAGCDLFALLCTHFVNTDGSPVSLDEAKQAALAGGWRGESRERRSDGNGVITMASLTVRVDLDGQLQQLILVNRDVTAQRREEHEALHDPLTGLPNRRLLTERLFEAYARACRQHQPIALLFIDLDGFKPINDSYGHSAGDEVLKAVAARLTATVRTTDTVARIGGDEFVVILHETGARPSVIEVTRRILDVIAEPVEFGEVEVKVRASIGIAHTTDPNSEISADELLDAADLAMYEAKRQRLGLAFAADSEIGQVEPVPGGCGQVEAVPGGCGDC
jgi:diguanylate cyclase (GGDEF)-like protein/PAS domain S-box-containing protein